MPKSNGLKILHIEDNIDDAELLKLELDRSNLSYTIKVVASKEELEASYSDEYSLIITDYNLSNFDGLRAIKWIRAHDPLVPIILFSGTVGEELAVDLLGAGANDFVLKSNLRRIPAAIEKAISQSKLVRDRLKFQEELVEKNLILDTIFNAFEDFVFLKDTQFQYVKVNQAFRDFLELTDKEIVGKKNSHFFNLNHSLMDDENDELALKTKQKVVYENERINSKGKRFIFEITKKPVISNGKVTGILGHAKNITERKEFQENAERSQFILNQAERLTGSVSFEYDSDRDIVNCSGNFSRVFGIEMSEISLRKFSSLVKTEDRPLFNAGINDAITNNREFYQSHRFTVDGGKFSHFKVLLRPDFRKDKKNLFYGTLVDVGSEHNNAISLMEKVEEDRKEIARELHDNLGQQLNAISMFISKISDNQPENKELLRTREIAHQAIDDLAKMLTTISVKQVEEHSLGYAIDKLLDYLPKELKIQKSIKIQEDKLSNFVKSQLYRVIQEALNNISKYSKATQINLDLKIDGSIIDVNIEDNGVGFDMEKVKHGNGLLNMTHRISSNNGLITIKSAKKEGTQITIKMPIN